jgi:G-patch domain
MKAMQSDSGSVSLPATPAPSLAELLKREPPPLPSEARVKPPVWTSIGPSNKGFSMLQRSGWNEGETLGPYALRQKPSEPTLPDALQLQPRPRSHPPFGQGKVEVKLEDFGDDICEVKHVDIVDLTLTSESEGEEEEEDAEDPIADSAMETEAALDEDVSGHGGRALLAPIATVLKADRMGIGLKPKTIAGPLGAYRIPQKRVTHNAAAMAAHIRAGEELRRQKREQGRGHRAFARKKRKEAVERKEMLAYLNS